MRIRLNVDKEINFSHERINQTNFNRCIEPAIKEFLNSNNLKITNFRKKYYNAIQIKKIIFCKFEAKHELIASCMLIPGEMKVGNRYLSVHFITNVITEFRYRNKGYARELINRVKEIPEIMESKYLIVIARKAVGEFYFNLGFRGFSHFPQIKNHNFVESKLKVTDFEQFRQAQISDLGALMNAYTHYSRSVENCIIRTEQDWTFILQNQSEIGFKVWISKKNDYLGYFVQDQKEIIEIYSEKSQSMFCKDIKEIFSNFKSINIEPSHPLFHYIMNKEYSYSERFEPKEAHLIQLIKEGDHTLEQFVNDISHLNGLTRLNINRMDQW